MGSCISKCRPKKHSQDECNHVQDKLVISHAPKTHIPLSNKISPSPPSPSNSTSSVSSFTCTTSNTSTSCSSFSSSSSVLSSKDRSFSNDFLWSCAKENPHVIRVNSIKNDNPLSSAPTKVHAPKLSTPGKPVVVPPKQFIPQRVVGSTPQKRLRLSSTLTRQKSFRKEPERLSSTYSLPSRTLRSPSPSRRFNGDKSRAILTEALKESCSKRMVGSKANAVSSVSSSLRRENFRPGSPNNRSSRVVGPCLRNKETYNQLVGSRIDEIAVGEVLSHHDIASIPLEDIDNPLISLDCFIFL